MNTKHMLMFMKSLLNIMQPAHLVFVFNQEVLRALVEVSSEDPEHRRILLRGVALHFLELYGTQPAWRVDDVRAHGGLCVALMSLTLEYDRLVEQSIPYPLWRRLDETKSAWGVDLTSHCMCGLMRQPPPATWSLHDHLRNLNVVFHSTWKKAAESRSAE